MYKKTVYLTSKRFDGAACKFKKSLAAELRKRGVKVVTGCSYDWLNCFRQYATFELALAFDFYRDSKPGCGLTLHKDCFYICRYFAYNVSDTYDALNPFLRWRDFKYVDSYDKEWRRFFNGVSAPIKAIFYLCNINNADDLENYQAIFDQTIRLFADETVHCLRSDNSLEEYQKNIRLRRMGLDD